MNLYCQRHLFSTARISLALLAVVCLPRTSAQSGAGPGGTRSEIAKATRVETEVVTISRSAAVPSEIRRRPGKFFLILNSTSVAGPPTLAVDSPTIPAAQVNTVGRGLNLLLLQRLKKAAVLVDLPTGELHLKSQATGRVLLKITIQ